MYLKEYRGKAAYTKIPIILASLIFVKACTVSTIDITDIGKWKIPTALPKDTMPVPDVSAPGKGAYSYVVNGERYWVKAVAVGYRETGLASWYGKKFHGRLTANQEVYDMYAYTAAHKNLPLPSYIKVFNHNNKRSVTVRVNDRGPFVKGRIVDLSYAAAKQIGIDKAGIAPVTIEVIDTPVAQTRDTFKVSKLSNKARVSYIQVGAYRKMENALDVMHSLKKQRLSPSLRRPHNNKASAMHFVRLGPFYTPQELDIVGKLLERNGFKHYQVFHR